MSHFTAWVVIPAEGDIDALVADAMAPHLEEYHDDGHRTGWWDWYQIGGRATGMLSGYDPRTDPRNVQQCDPCQGTGQPRRWSIGTTCNGCGGAGKALVWPTRYRRHDGDWPAIEVALDHAVDGMTPHTVVTPSGSDNYENHGCDDSRWQQRVLEMLAGYEGMRVAVVDCHS